MIILLLAFIIAEISVAAFEFKQIIPGYASTPVPAKMCVSSGPEILFVFTTPFMKLMQTYDYEVCADQTFYLGHGDYKPVYSIELFPKRKLRVLCLTKGKELQPFLYLLTKTTNCTGDILKIKKKVVDDVGLGREVYYGQFNDGIYLVSAYMMASQSPGHALAAFKVRNLANVVKDVLDEPTINELTTRSVVVLQ
jgi:hypothetical protein